MTTQVSMTTKVSKFTATLVALCALLLTGCDNPNEDEGNNQDFQQEQNENDGEQQENDGEQQENDGEQQENDGDNEGGNQQDEGDD